MLLTCSYDLLCLCRRAPALCIGADVSWVLRHLETWRNPSDKGSRRVPGFGRVRFVWSCARPLAPQHVSGVLGALALSLNFVTAIRGSHLVSSEEALMSHLAAT